jgi:hypothetical protein
VRVCVLWWRSSAWGLDSRARRVAVPAGRVPDLPILAPDPLGPIPRGRGRGPQPKSFFSISGVLGQGGPMGMEPEGG